MANLRCRIPGRPALSSSSLHTSWTIFLGLGTMLVYNEMKPQIDAWVNGKARLMVMLAFMLVPSFHALGAAVAYACPCWSVRYGCFSA